MNSTDWHALRPAAGPTDSWRAGLRDHLFHSWGSGRPLLVESYLDSIPELQDDNLGIALLIKAEAQCWEAVRQPLPDGMLGARLQPFSATPIDVPDLPRAYTKPLPVIGQFGRYTRHLEFGAGDVGRGSMGDVFFAHDDCVKRHVILKLIKADKLDELVMSGSTPFPGVTPRQRFYREARAAAALTHPNLVRLHTYNFVTSDERTYNLPEPSPFMDLEFIPGPSLDIYTVSRARRPAPFDPAGETLPMVPAAHDQQFLSVARVCEIVATLARAVAFAHARGILHRDLKPANVRFDRFGQPILVDFGLAELTRPLAADPEKSTGPVGTARYMAPEAFMTRQAEARSEVYSLGLILHELLTGIVPLGGSTWAEIWARRRETDGAFTAGHEDRIPQELRQICTKAIRWRVEDRYQTMHQFADDLSGFAVPSLRAIPVVTKHRWPAAIAGLGLVAAGAGFGTWLKPSQPAATPASIKLRTPAVIERVARYVRDMSADEGARTRFLTLHHLVKDPDSPVAWARYRDALTDALRAISGVKTLDPIPVPGTEGTTFAIDLAQFGWTATTWERLLRNGRYPYAVSYEGRSTDDALANFETRIRERTGTEVPIVRADWLISAMQSPDLQRVIAGRKASGEPKPAVIWPESVKAAAATYLATHIDADTAAAELDLDSTDELMAAIRANRLPQDTFGKLLPNGGGIPRANWERPSPGSTTSPFQRGIGVLARGTPVRLIPANREND